MVRGCLAWQHDGLTPIPESVRAAELFDHYSQWADARRLQPRERLTCRITYGRTPRPEHWSQSADCGPQTGCPGLRVVFTFPAR